MSMSNTWIPIGYCACCQWHQLGGLKVSSPHKWKSESLLWPPCVADSDIILCSCDFFLLVLLFSSPILSGWRLDVYRTWCGLSAILECMSEMCCTRLAENTRRKNYTKYCHLHTIAQLCRAISYLRKRHVSTIGKKSFNSNISSTCPCNIVNFGTLRAEIGWWVWGTRENFNSFRVLASLLHRRRSMEVNHTSHDVWPSPGLLHNI